MNDHPKPSRAERRALRDAQHRAKHEADRESVIDRLENLATDDDIDNLVLEGRQDHRDIGSAIALAVLAVIQIAIVRSLASYPAIATQLHLQLHPGLWPYVAAVACFLPLMYRRRYPGPVLLATAIFTGLYLAMPWPPAIVILAPMTALFTVSERYGGRRAVPIGIVLGAIVLGVSAMTVSVSYTVAQVVAILALLALSAALGHTAQTRRELFVEVKRKREEESLRRVEEERLRIARDVHDIMAHSLTLMTLQADAGSTTVDDAEKSRAAFTVIGDTGRATLRDLRSMLSVLAGDSGDDSPRQPVPDLGELDTLVRSVRETGLDVALATSGDFESVPSAVAVSAYRIVQEALTNVVRHAHAEHATVRVDVKDDKLALLVIDDGAGAAAGAAASAGTGRGLIGMRERVDVLGGTISAGPGESGGFEVRATIPLTRSKR
ncbi:MAG: histidine kinase [Coriobacteriia bacterium]|nr:histidine kinase [Coriobacteriia bacterium]